MSKVQSPKSKSGCRRSLFIVHWSLVIFCCAATAVHGASFLLAYKFQPKQVLRYEVSASLEGKVRFGTEKEPPKMNVSGELKMQIAIDVLEVDEGGNAALSLGVERVSFEGNVGERSIKLKLPLPKEQPPTPPGALLPLLSVLPLMEEKRPKMKVSPQGKVTEVLEALPSAATAGLTTARLFFSQPELPEKEIKVGERWRQRIELSPPAMPQKKFKASYTYRLAELKKDGESTLAKIDVSGQAQLVGASLRPTPSPPLRQAQGAAPERSLVRLDIPSFSEEMSGEVWLDVQAGRIVRQQGKAKTSLRLLRSEKDEQGVIKVTNAELKLTVTWESVLLEAEAK